MGSVVEAGRASRRWVRPSVMRVMAVRRGRPRSRLISTRVYPARCAGSSAFLCTGGERGEHCKRHLASGGALAPSSVWSNSVCDPVRRCHGAGAGRGCVVSNRLTAARGRTVTNATSDAAKWRPPPGARPPDTPPANLAGSPLAGDERLARASFIRTVDDVRDFLHWRRTSDEAGQTRMC